MAATRQQILNDFEEIKKQGFTWEQYYDSLIDSEKKLVSDIVYKAPTLGNDIIISPTQSGYATTDGILDYNDSQIDNSQKSGNKKFKMPTWGWIAIGIGGAVALTLIISLAVKAGKKAKAV